MKESTESGRFGPLQDVTVLDCTAALAGPFGTALLADLGADVIKIEPPSGDGARSVPPRPQEYAYEANQELQATEYGAFFGSVNRNKRSIILNFKDRGDCEIFLKMCEKADAVVENMRAGVMDRLGIGYDVIQKLNNRLVYGCIRGFGDPRTGESPYSHWPAYDIVAQSMSGYVKLTGPEDDYGYPSGVSVGDVYPGTLLALGLVAGIHYARSTGEGQFFDVAMYDAMLAFTETIVANYGWTKVPLGARGRHHPNLAPFGLFPTKDGAVAIAAPVKHQWDALCDVMGRDDLKTEPDVRNAYLRKRNFTIVEEAITNWSSKLSKREVVDRVAGKLPCGPVNSIEEIFEDPHVWQRRMIRDVNLEGETGKVGMIGNPIKYTKTESDAIRRPPNIGEHSEEILREFGINLTPSGSKQNDAN